MNSSKTNNQKLSTSTLLTLLFFLGTVGLSGSLAWQKHSLSKEETQLKESIEKKESLIAEYLEKDRVGEKYTSQEILEKAEASRIIWSQKLKDVSTLENKNISFLSISLGKGSKVSITATAKGKEDISRLIETIKADPLFANPFVAGFAETKVKNQTIYNFSITFSSLK